MWLAKINMILPCILAIYPQTLYYFCNCH